MREIKFRAWDKKLKEIIHPESIVILKGKAIANKIDINKPLHEQDQGLFFPDWILMQYTGLKDKKGKEIYEGDIFKMPKDKGIVKFEDGMFLVEITNGLHSPSLWGEIHFGEVIGNIHENPELLKQEDDSYQKRGAELEENLFGKRK